VLKAAIDANLMWLAIIGVIASVIAAFYYIRIVFYMYFGKEADGTISRMAPAQWVVLMAMAAVMVLGVINLFGIDPLAAVAAEALVR